MKKELAQSIHKALERQNLAGILDRWNYPATRAKAWASWPETILITVSSVC